MSCIFQEKRGRNTELFNKQEKRKEMVLSKLKNWIKKCMNEGAKRICQVCFFSICFELLIKCNCVHIISQNTT